jgi:hypothetical protein
MLIIYYTIVDNFMILKLIFIDMCHYLNSI